MTLIYNKDAQCIKLFHDVIPKALAAMTATHRKRSLENKYCTIITTCQYSNHTVMARYWTASKYRKLQICCTLLTLPPDNANMLFSRCYFAQNSTELFLSACRTCCTLVFALSTKPILKICGIASSREKLRNRSMSKTSLL